MSKKRFSAATLVAAAVAVIATSVALADPTSSHSGGANAVQIGVVRIDPNHPMAAYVTGRYTCPTGAEAHLFVSVKQVASGLPDSRLKEEGSSRFTSAWLETHPTSDTWTCDGAWHVQTWRITDDPTDPSYMPWDYGFGGALIPGQVYVQFCWDDDSGNDAWHAYSEQFARASY
jgi:hypothetical protein